MINERMQAAMQELQDAMVAMAHLEKRQSKILKSHTEHLAEIDEYRRRTDQNLAEITDKLKGPYRLRRGSPHEPGRLLLGSVTSGSA